MSGAKGDQVENAGGVQGRMDKRTKASKPGNSNGLSSLNGHHERCEDTEEDVDRGESDRARGWNRSSVRVSLAFRC